MHHIISQSVRVYSYLFITIIFHCSLYGSQTPYVSLPTASADAISITIPPAQAHLQSPPAEPLSRSVSHGNFQHAQKSKKHKKQEKHTGNHGSAGQRHENSAHTINDFSINVAAVKPEVAPSSKKSWGETLRGPVNVLMITGLCVVIYLQARITDQAEQIGASTSSLDTIGNQLDSNTAQIAGAITELDKILELLLNITKRG